MTRDSLPRHRRGRDPVDGHRCALARTPRNQAETPAVHPDIYQPELHVHPPRPRRLSQGRPCIEPIIRRNVEHATSSRGERFTANPCHAGLWPQCHVKPGLEGGRAMSRALSYSSGESGTPLLGDTIGGNFDATVTAFGAAAALVDRPTARRWPYAELAPPADALAT